MMVSQHKWSELICSDGRLLAIKFRIEFIIIIIIIIIINNNNDNNNNNNNNNNGNFIKCFSLHTYTIVNLSHKGNLRLAI